tara:strand:- start:447 stop:776 length:330 start_codon:yes stop_codon:yes gene_type:complete
MAHIFIKTTKDNKSYYLVWSTVVDAFITVIAGDGLEDYIKYNQGERGLRLFTMNYAERLEETNTTNTRGEEDFYAHMEEYKTFDKPVKEEINSLIDEFERNPTQKFQYV